MSTSHNKAKNKSEIQPPAKLFKPYRPDDALRRTHTEANEDGPTYRKINLYPSKPTVIEYKRGVLPIDKKIAFNALRAEIKANSTVHNNHNTATASGVPKITKIKNSIISKQKSNSKERSVRKSLNSRQQHIKIVATEPYQKKSMGFSKAESKMVESIFGKEKRGVSQKDSNINKVISNNLAGMMLKNQEAPQTQPHIRQSLNLPKKQAASMKGAALYTYDQIVGSGTFGTVYKGRNKQTLEVVAIKKVLQDPKYKNRQHEILKELDHYNVLRMKDSFFTVQNDQQYLNVIMDYFPSTAYSVIRKYAKARSMSSASNSSTLAAGSKMPPILVKLYSYQMIRSLLYLEKLNICHRDIKPQNILIDTETNHLVLCDFGSAKRLVPGEPNISYICSRCYRAPELIFGATQYTCQIDMWSVGCVIAEMIVFEPLFMANSNLDQLVEIIKVIGTPSQAEVLAMNPAYDMSQYQFPRIPAKDWRKVLKQKVEPLLISLMGAIMKYDPEQRLNPCQALCHPYFDQLRDEKSYRMLCKSYKIPQLFNFDSTDCTKEQYKALVPSWYSSAK